MLGPGVEVEVHDGGLPPRAALQEDRPGVARPAARGGMEHEFDAAWVSSRARKIAARDLLLGLAVDEDADALTRANLANDLSINPTDGADLVGPIDLIVRPHRKSVV